MAKKKVVRKTVVKRGVKGRYGQEETVYDAGEDGYKPKEEKIGLIRKAFSKVKEAVPGGEKKSQPYKLGGYDPSAARERYKINMGEVSNTTFSGREEKELELNTCLNECYKTPERGIKRNWVNINGEAGIGKTRLVYEALKDRDYIILSGRTLSGITSPYQPLNNAVKDFIEDLEKKGGKEGVKNFVGKISKEAGESIVCRGVVSVLGKTAAVAAGPVGILGAVLFDYAIDGGKHLYKKYKNKPAEEIMEEELKELNKMDQKRKQEEMNEYFYKVFDVISREQKAILIVDDIQWADSGTLDTLQYLSRNMRKNNNFAIVTTCRKEEVGKGVYDVKQRASREKLYREVDLDELDFDSTRKILNFVSKGAVGKKATEFIFERAGGNPLYIEELAKNFIEEYGRDWFEKVIGKEVKMPSTLKDVIKRRIERIERDENIPDETLDVLRYAAVIGKDFDYDTLFTSLNIGFKKFAGKIKIKDEEKIGDEKVSECLGILKERCVIKDSDSDYIFPQELVRKVVYDSMEQSLRRNIHNKAGYSIEAINEDLLDDVFVELANHFVLAENKDKAYEYSLKAGKQIFDLVGGTESAYLHYKNAYKFAKGEEKVKALSKMAKAEYILGEWESALEHNDEILEICGDEKKKSRARIRKGDILMKKKENWDKAIEILNENIEICERIKDKKGEGRSYRLLGETFYNKSKYDEALKYYKDSLKISEEMDNKLEIGRINLEIAKTLDERGDAERAISLYEKTFPILEENRDFINLVKAYNNISTIFYDRGKLEKAYESLVKGRDISKKHSFKRGIVYTTVGIGENLSHRGKILADKGREEESKEMFKDAERELKNGIKISKEIEETRIIGAIFQDIGILKGYTHDWDISEKYFLKASRKYEDTPYYYADVLEGWGKMLIDKGDKSEAKEKLDEARKIFEELKSSSRVEKCNDLIKSCC